MLEQVHGNRPPNPILRDTELLVGDVRDAGLVGKALRGVDAVIHLAAEVGVGQSMYEIERYVGGNDLGTAVLLQALIEQPVRACRRRVFDEHLRRGPLSRRRRRRLVEDATRGDGGRLGPARRARDGR